MKESEVWRRVIELHERYQKQSCPECGRETTGTTSEGGCKWAVCPDCYGRIMAGEEPLSCGGNVSTTAKPRTQGRNGNNWRKVAHGRQQHPLTQGRNSKTGRRANK